MNVLDIVSLANCILTNSCVGLTNGCAADLNGDGVYNVLDIVNLVNLILDNFSGSKIVHKGSSIKFCLIASGEAEIWEAATKATSKIAKIFGDINAERQQEVVDGMKALIEKPSNHHEKKKNF